MHRYERREDAEIVGFLAAQFAYGRISLFKLFLEEVFSRMGEEPLRFIDEGDFNALKGLYYRFQKEEDIVLLFRTLRTIYREFGSIGEMIGSCYQGDMREALWEVRRRIFPGSEALTFFFPKPSPTNPLKRWNLYFRWMVRKDEIDLGLWDFADKSRLVMPLDTHIFKIGRCLGWTGRSSQSYGAARDITDALKAYSPDDPLKYDLFLCHRIGIGAGCKGKRGPQCKEECLLYEI